MREKYFEKNDPVYISESGKVCESLGLADNLKVKFESICAEVFSVSALTINVSTWPVLFKEQESIKVWSYLWKWIMSRTKEITEDLRKELMFIRLERLQTISKEFGLHKSTVRQIVYKWRNSRPLLPSREVVDQQRSLQSRTCNSLRGCKSSQGNF